MRLALAAAAVAVAGCGGGGASTAGSTASSSTSTSTSTSTSSTTSSSTTSAPGVPSTTAVVATSVAPPPVQAAPATTAPSIQSCPAIAAVPSGATDVTTAPVDFDGDGTADVLRVYQDGSTWHARAEMANTGVHDQVLPPVTGTPMTAIGGATVDNDASQEAWVKVGSGASTDIVGLFVFRQCQLQRVELNGAAAEFPIGASLTHAEGLECFGPNVGIERFDTTSSDGSTYTGTSETFTIDLSTSTPSLVAGATTPISESDPPGGAPFDRLSQFRCGGLSTIP